MTDRVTLLRVFLPFAFGYFLSYLFRVINAMIEPDLVAELGLGAADLGLLTSAYFLSFALFQLPLGILLDHFGPRKTEAGLLVFAALGAAVFGLSDGTGGLFAGRALIGFGVSACLMAAFKAYALWVPKERLPLINGFQMAAGGLGALTGTAPVEIALTVTDWRGLFLGLAVITLAASVIIFLTVPKRNEAEAASRSGGLGQQIRGIGEIFTSPVFWWIAPLTVASQSAFLAIQSLWTGPWLADVGGLDRDGVARHLMMIAFAMIAGFVTTGVIADRLRHWGIKPVTIAISGMGVFLSLQATIALGLTDNILIVWMAFGFFGTTGILPYAALSQKYPVSLAGRVNTGLNLLAFIGAFSAQWMIGVIIEQWPRVVGGGYHPDGYRAAMLTLLAVQVMAMAWLVVFRKGRLAFSRA